MAYPHAPEHIRTTWTGVLGSRATPVEAFSMGLSFHPGSVSAATDSTKFSTLNALADALAVEWSDLAGSLTSAVHLTRVRCALVGDDGKTRKTSGGQYIHADEAVTTRSGGVVSFTPYQVALAVSLGSLAAGPTGKGRFFLPAPDLSGQPTDGLMTTTKQAAFVTAVTNFLNGCNAAALAAVGGQGLVVASGGSLVSGLAPALHPVTSHRIGRVYDTMRSRRRDLPEEYVQTAVSV